MLREEIAKYIRGFGTVWSNKEIDTVAADLESLFSSEYDKRPSGLEVVKTVDDPEDKCWKLEARELTVGEVVELLKRMNGWEVVTGERQIVLADGSRIRMKQ